MSGQSPSVIFGKGVELDFGDAGKFICLPPRLKDLAELEQYLRIKRCTVAMRTLEAVGTPKHEMTAKLAYMSGMSFEPGELQLALNREADVVGYMLWLCLRRKSPNLREERVQEMIMALTTEQQERISAQIRGLIAGDQVEENPESDDCSDPSTSAEPSIADGKNESPGCSATIPG